MKQEHRQEKLEKEALSNFYYPLPVLNTVAYTGIHYAEHHHVIMKQMHLCYFPSLWKRYICHEGSYLNSSF